MIDTLYVEREILEWPRTKAILSKFPKAHLILCDRYGEVFNVKSQNFRLQKQRPSLILARKYGQKVLKVPSGYTLGNPHNFYFSYMLNCMYDCRYCFLQGMYRSAHFVVFINYEEFQNEIEHTMKQCPDGATFFSGYDGDSLNFEHISSFLDSFIPFFKKHPLYEMEVRTKSMNVRSLLDKAPVENIIIAMSLNPTWVINRFEEKTPRLHQRLRALEQLQAKGWKIGLRFDPLIYHPNWETHYEKLFNDVFETLTPRLIHSVTLGPFRLPLPHYKRMQNLFPDEPLFHHAIEKKSSMMSYKKELEIRMQTFCQNQILNHIDPSQFFPSTF